MTVVCDASPLIVLAKLDRLNLLNPLFGRDVVVLECVANEVTSRRASVIETQRLTRFFETGAQVVPFSESDVESKSLSKCDQSVLTYALSHSVDWLVVDERLLRRIAIEKGVAVVGTLGVLVESANRRLISRAEARANLQQAVGSHNLRISVALYQRILAELRD